MYVAFNFEIAGGPSDGAIVAVSVPVPFSREFAADQAIDRFMAEGVYFLD